MSTTPHADQLGSFGLPYGPAGSDDYGYYVECPVCGERFAAPADSAYTEDGITKGAAGAYAAHYADMVIAETGRTLHAPASAGPGPHYA